MVTRKVIQGRNARISLENDEIAFIKGLVDAELNRNQKFDRERMLFLLQLYKKLDKAK